MNDNYQRIINSCKYDIDKIKEWIDKHLTDSLIQYLVPYAVVRASGTIECVFKRMIYDYLSAEAGEGVKKYLEHMIIESSSNPTTGMIARIVQDFDGKKADKFSANLSQEEKHQLNSLVSSRNDVAHGKNIYASIDIVITEFNAGIKVLRKLEQVLSES